MSLQNTADGLDILAAIRGRPACSRSAARRSSIYFEALPHILALVRLKVNSSRAWPIRVIRDALAIITERDGVHQNGRNQFSILTFSCARAQNQQRPPNRAAAKEEVKHGAYPRTGGYHHAPVIGAAIRLNCTNETLDPLHC